MFLLQALFLRNVPLLRGCWGGLGGNPGSAPPGGTGTIVAQHRLEPGWKIPQPSSERNSQGLGEFLGVKPMGEAPTLPLRLSVCTHDENQTFCSFQNQFLSSF